MVEIAGTTRQRIFFQPGNGSLFGQIWINLKGCSIFPNSTVKHVEEFRENHLQESLMQKLLNTGDEGLIQNARSNYEAFLVLYRAYFPRVYAYVAYRVGRSQDAEDITSDVFLRVVEKLGMFEWRGEGSFAAWIFRLAHDRVADFYRQNSRTESDLSLDELPDLRANELLPAEIILQKEKFACLQRLFATLSPRRQEIITLKFFGGLRNNEIAEVLGLNERTVAAHLCRGLEDLHQRYVKSYGRIENEASHE